MPAESALPSNMAVRDMLEELLGRDVKVAPSEAWAPTLRDPGAVAVYVNDGIRLSALITCNFELSIALGASIGLIPATRAAECLKDGRLSDDLAENLYEVLNIMAALFNPPDAPHVKLFEMHAPGKPLTVDLSEQLRLLGSREDLKVEVAGYGGGMLSLVRP